MRAVVIGCAVCAVSGCNASRLDAPESQAPRSSLRASRLEATAGMPVPIDSRIRIRLHETLRPSGGRPLELQCETERRYPYLGYPIVTESVVHQRLASIDFKYVLDNGGGLTFPGPARSRVQLGVPEETRYSLLFRVNGEVVPTKLVVSPDSFQVLRGEGRWIAFPLPTLHRVPPRTLWGLIGWGPIDQSRRAQAFLDSLVALGARLAPFPPGDYEYFVVANDGTVRIPGSHGYYHERAFLFRYEGDRSVLGGVVRRFGDPTSIAMYDDLGAMWLSWIPGVRIWR